MKRKLNKALFCEFCDVTLFKSSDLLDNLRVARKGKQKCSDLLWINGEGAAGFTVRVSDLDLIKFLDFESMFSYSL